MMRHLLKFAGLANEEKLFFLKAILRMGYYRLALKLKPLQTLLEETKNKAETKQRNKQTNLSALRAARLANIAGKLVPLATCLSKTLAGHTLLAEQGHMTIIHIGVAKDDKAGFEAHAWLTYNDIIVLGSLPDLKKYTELPF